jgi:hypothetical protein
MIIVKEAIKPPLVIIPALSYLMLATRQAVTHIRESRWFQSMYTLQGKLIHTTHISYVSTRTPLIHFLRAVHIRGNLSRSRQQRWTDPLALRKKGVHPDPHHIGWQFHGCIPSFSPVTTIQTVGKSQASVGNRLHWFTGPISQACDQYVNQHRRGLQLWRCWHSKSLLSTDGPPLCPNGPIKSQVNILKHPSKVDM